MQSDMTVPVTIGFDGGDEWEDITSKITWNTTYVDTANTTLKLYKNKRNLVQATGQVKIASAISSELQIATISDTSIIQVLPVYKGNTPMNAVLNSGYLFVTPYGGTIQAGYIYF